MYHVTRRVLGGISETDSSHGHEEEAEEEEEGIFLLVTLAVLILISIVAYTHSKLEKYLTVLPLASMCILFGVILGFVLTSLGEIDAAFSFQHEFFFTVLLPPCIFAAGFELDKEVFFHNLGSIVLLAFLGTFISSMSIGSAFWGLCYLVPEVSIGFFDSLVFGSLISAVDPVATICVLSNVGVDKNLYMLIFGESVLNDAVSIILFRTFNKLAQQTEEINIVSEFFGGLGQILISAIISFSLGTSFGLITSLVFKYLKFTEHESSSTFHIMVSVEISFFVFTSMAPYYIAEHLGYSGIMALLFNAIWVNKYGIDHLSHHAHEFVEAFIRFLQFLAEHFLFTYLGMAIFTVEHSTFHPGLAIVSIFLCLLARALSVYPLCSILNQCRKTQIETPWQVLMWWAGLRGPVAFALALMVEKHRALLESTTLVIVLFTTILMGGSTTALVEYLGLQTGEGGSEDISSDDITHKSAYWDSNHWFITLDRNYLTPWFGNVEAIRDSHHRDHRMPGRSKNKPLLYDDSDPIKDHYSLRDLSLSTTSLWADSEDFRGSPGHE